jgi:hypothetical protein
MLHLDERASLKEERGVPEKLDASIGRLGAKRQYRESSHGIVGEKSP